MTFTGQYKPDNKMAAAAEATTSEAVHRPMDDRHRRILRHKLRERLVKDMDLEQILIKMAAAEVFNEADEDEIRKKETRQRQNDELLSKLTKKGATAYDSFKEALQKVHPPLAVLFLEAGKRF